MYQGPNKELQKNAEKFKTLFEDRKSKNKGDSIRYEVVIEGDLLYIGMIQDAAAGDRKKIKEDVEKLKKEKQDKPNP